MKAFNAFARRRNNGPSLRAKRSNPGAIPARCGKMEATKQKEPQEIQRNSGLLRFARNDGVSPLFGVEF
jgi:hypothetical protein